MLVSEAELLRPLTDWLEMIFAPEYRVQTLAMLQADLPNGSAGPTDAQVRLTEAKRRLTTLIAAVEAGVEIRTLAPRINAAQAEVDTLERATALATANHKAVGRQELVELLDDAAANFRDLFAPEADPGEVNSFLTAIKMRARLDLCHTHCRRNCRSHATPGARERWA